MAVRIRLQRHGANNAPFYRVVVAESRTKRDGRFVENLGTYDPANPRRHQQDRLNLERAEYWLKQGAIPSDTVKSLISRARKTAQATAAAAPVNAESPAAPAPAVP